MSRPKLWESWNWSTEGTDRFPVGTYVRIHADSLSHGRKIARVTHTHGRAVTVRIGAESHRFDCDWLFPVRYVSVRFHGPAIARDGSSIGSRYVASGMRGDRMQYTRKADHAITPDANMECAALDYARDRLGMCNPSAEYWQDRNTGARVFALTDYGRCDCSEESGPCEWHGETLVSREGASLRTADELGHEFLTDVASVCGAWISPEFERDTIRIGNALADNRSAYGVAWLPTADETDDGEDMPDTLADMLRSAETFLSDHGYSVWWEDGYRIIRITGGPLAQ